jgi:hypothetical protein
VNFVLWAMLFMLPRMEQSADFNAPRQVRRLPGDGQKTVIRVFTWNIDHGTHLNEIAEDLRRREADLCLLQEVDWNAARSGLKDVTLELAGRLDMNAAYGVEFEELSQERNGPAYIGQATLTRLPLNRTRVLRFQRQSTFWHPHAWLLSSLPLMQRRLGSRIALVTELQDFWWSTTRTSRAAARDLSKPSSWTKCLQIWLVIRRARTP